MTAQFQPLPVEGIADGAERRRIIDSALGTTRAEGVSPGPEVIALSERYVAGEISLPALGVRIRALSAKSPLPAPTPSASLHPHLYSKPSSPR